MHHMHLHTTNLILVLLQMSKVLRSLQRISPFLEHIKLNKKRVEEFPELVQVLKGHNQSTDYMIQLFKEPVNKNCTCKGCTTGIIKLVRMTREVY